MKYYDIYCLNGEVWKDIPNYEGIYQASTFGRIRSIDGKTTFTKLHGIRTWKGRIIRYKGENKSTGYRVGLWKDGKHKDYLVARLVASTFLGTPVDFYSKVNTSNRITVNHIDGNRFNNELDNLEWVTLADNIKHAFSNGLMPYKFVRLADKNGNTFEFKSMSKASVFIGRSHGYISNCITKGKTIEASNGCCYTVELFEYQTK